MLRKFFCFGTEILKKFQGGKRGGSSKIRIGIFFKKSSNFVQQTQQDFIFGNFGLGGLGASRLGIAESQNFPSVFEFKMQSAVGNLKVRRFEKTHELKIHYQSFSFAQRANIKRYNPPTADSCLPSGRLPKSDFEIF